MDIFLVNQNNPHADSLMRKLAEQSKPGAIIPLSDEEMELWRSKDFQHIGINMGEENQNIVELEKGRGYVFVANQDVNIDDILQLEERLSIKVGIVRTKG